MITSKNKLRGVCQHCKGEFRLQSDGQLYKHGHRDNPCIGSGLAPIIGSIQQSQSSNHPGPRTNAATSLSDSQQSQNAPGSTNVVTNVHNDTVFEHPAYNIAVIKNIPKSARRACSTLLASLILDVINNIASAGKWNAFMSFAPTILGKTSRGGKKRNLANTIIKRISAFPNSDENAGGSNSRNNKRTNCSEAIRAKAAIAKIEDGNLRAAVRILSSDDQPAEDNIATLTELLSKHPAAPSDTLFPTDTLTENFAPIQVTERDVKDSISSFPSGSSGGFDLLLPQHLKDMMGVDCDPSLLTNLTNLVNVMLQGRLPAHISRIVYGGRLIALSKKQGGIRPITVGYVLRRIAAKCANHSVLESVSRGLLPRQLGVGIKGGIEANVAPGIYAFCKNVYANYTVIKFNDHEISSATGMQQGDPLGSLLFSISIHPILERLKSELILGYLDDLTVGGGIESVCEDLRTIKTEAEILGLKLNASKCDIVTAAYQSCWRVTWNESRVESRVMRVESESSHESLRSVLESSQVTSHRGLESSRVESHKVVESCPSQTLYSIFIRIITNHCNQW